MRKTHAAMPMTGQEQSVRDLLISKRLSFETHHVFELSPRVRMSVDFLVFKGAGVVLECTCCTRSKGSAMSEARRRSAFMEYRFGLLKKAYPAIVCGALVEAPKEDQEVLSETVLGVLHSAGFVACSLQELSALIDRVIV
jgi:hypothetical protein